jgi:hypothetical protein
MEVGLDYNEEVHPMGQEFQPNTRLLRQQLVWRMVAKMENY